MNKKNPTFPILIVDDEEEALQSFVLALKSFGLNNLLLCRDGRNVPALMKNQKMELIILDLTMPRLSGEELLPEIVHEYPEVPVMVITGKNDVDTAVRCLHNGAKDYLLKPVEKNRLKTSITRQLEFLRLQRENMEMKRQLLGGDSAADADFSEITTRNPAMLSIFKYAQVVAKTSEPILITGETGVGKELLAKAIHRCSQRKGEFISVNVSGLDDNVFSDTLFGHQKGAFTDAFQSRGGLVEKAAGGTLFLDEIGDLSLSSQIKLLRLLQENEYYPLGSDVPKKAEIRVVAATGTASEDLMKSGHFRKDLFFRLDIHHIRIPPLRQRLDDVPALVHQFIEEAARAQNKKKPDFPIELLTLLMSYAYPGNIRELRAMIVDAVSTHRFGTLSLKSFRDRIARQIKERNRHPEPILSGETAESSSCAPLPTIQEAEARLILLAMKQAHGNQTVASQLLGIARQTLNKKLKTIKMEDL